MEIITLVEEYSFLHAHYIDLFNIDQYWYYLNYFVIMHRAHSLFSFILMHALTYLYLKQHAHLPFYFILKHANLPFLL